MRNLNSDLYYLLIYRCKYSQLAGCQWHGNMACDSWMETWDVAIIYTGGTRTCVTVQWITVDRMTLSPAKLNLIWTTLVYSHVITEETPNTKLKYCQCTSTALLCNKHRHFFTIRTSTNEIWYLDFHSSGLAENPITSTWTESHKI